MGVVEQPVDGGGRQSLGHQLVEAGRVQVRADRDGASFVGGVDQAVEPFGRVRADRQQADIIDDDQVRAQDRADRAGDRVVGAVTMDQDAQPLEREPGHLQAGFDRELAERFEEEGLPGPRGAADDQVLAASDPLEGPERGLGRGRDRRVRHLPGGERLATREAGRRPPRRQGRPFAAGDLGGEQRPQQLGRLPALGPGGREHLGGGAPERWQAQAAQQGVQVVGQGWCFG